MAPFNCSTLMAAKVGCSPATTEGSLFTTAQSCPPSSLHHLSPEKPFFISFSDGNQAVKLYVTMISVLAQVTYRLCSYEFPSWFDFHAVSFNTIWSHCLFLLGWYPKLNCRNDCLVLHWGACSPGLLFLSNGKAYTNPFPKTIHQLPNLQ